MRNFWVISKYNFRDVLSRRFFKISTVVCTLLILVVLMLPDLVFRFGFLTGNKEYLFYIVDNKNNIFHNHLDLNLYANSMSSLLDGEYFFHLVDDDTGLEQVHIDFEKGIINGYLVVNNENSIEIVTSNTYSDLKFILDRYIMSTRLSDKDKEMAYVNYTFELSQTPEIKFNDLLKKHMLLGLLSTLVYVIFIMFGQFISISVNIEKSSKITEIFLTKVKLLNIILGRIFGVVLACTLQLVYFLVVLYLTTQLLSIRYFPFIKGVVILDFSFILRYVFYFILGVIFYGLVFMLVGSIVNKTEDLSIGFIPITFLLSLGYIVLVISVQFPQSNLIELLRYVPFFVPFVIISDTSVHIFSEVGMISIMVLSIVLFTVLNVNVIKSVIKFKGSDYTSVRKDKN